MHWLGVGRGRFRFRSLVCLLIREARQSSSSARPRRAADRAHRWRSRLVFAPSRSRQREPIRKGYAPASVRGAALPTSPQARATARRSKADRKSTMGPAQQSGHEQHPRCGPAGHASPPRSATERRIRARLPPAGWLLAAIGFSLRKRMRRYRGRRDGLPGISHLDPRLGRSALDRSLDAPHRGYL